MGGALEASSAPGKRMSNGFNRYSEFAKTWMTDKYNVLGRGIAPDGVDKTMADWNECVWRSKDVCKDSSLANERVTEVNEQQEAEIARLRQDDSTISKQFQEITKKQQQEVDNANARYAAITAQHESASISNLELPGTQRQLDQSKSNHLVFQQEISNLKSQVHAMEKEYNKLQVWAQGSHTKNLEMEQEIEELKARQVSVSPMNNISSSGFTSTFPGYIRQPTIDSPSSPYPSIVEPEPPKAASKAAPAVKPLLYRTRIFLIRCWCCYCCLLL
ncbi:Hypothetical predicted protein [Lecanosticta acicola]|uniref:Uncharacterized protein n=1 Tax=Lecanosticta acicola TaxID=111012 RepID=A0AAI8YZ97_9PEZI|nr:Hypothetical predicted protein [Lecanosticta acicola]